jgi:hypothetical protein
MHKLQSKHLQEKEPIPEKIKLRHSNHPLIGGWFFSPVQAGRRLCLLLAHATW